MSIAGGIALVVVGAILTFALTGSVRGVDLHIVGVILMLAGAVGLLLPLPVRTRFVTRSRSNRPAARSSRDVIDDAPHTLVEPPRHDSALDDDRRTPHRRRPGAWMRRD
jgi:hypothetical protein